MKKEFLYLSCLVIVLVTALSACAPRKITRVNPDKQVDISGRWNDTDATSAAKDLTSQVLSGNWLNDYVVSKGRKPVVIVGLIRNKSHEHIDAEIITKEIEKSFIQMQKVRVVQGGKFRETIRSERAEQQENASLSTVKKFGLETGADFMLQGSINSMVDARGKRKVVYYQIDFELTNIQTNEKVWIGDKKIKKYIEN